ncbi:hypothetical protein ACFFUB_03800 [Algimonas porphyrae]|uniref:DUF2178 domain-containing protein n=1 Tax=Algimonas porphyrae TaxID=1128113 RepID=A0ABQ5UYX1_9PROT|nr:hypothetical protein [Algimonas porphyrae]GLQ20109.1 hypothetical protein GCM10007854_10640 [Algimonas porphyrae]
MGHMSFNEKSAWAMILALGLASVVYLGPVLSAWFRAGVIIPPAPFVIAFTVVVIILSIITHIIVALSNPSEATETRDERDRAVIHFAGHWSGIVFAVGVITCLLNYLVFPNGDLMFHGIFISLIIASLIEYGLRLFSYRRVL